MLRVLTVSVFAAVLAAPLAFSGALHPKAASLYLAPAGSDSGVCSQAAPCQSLDRAYRLARPGQVVQLAAGTYPAQAIRFDQSKADAPTNVIFTAAPGTTPNIAGELLIRGRHITLENLTIDDWYAGANDSSVPESQQAGYLTFRNVRVQDFYIGGASNVSVLGGSVGPVADAGAGAAQVKSCYLCSYPVQNIRIDGVNFHDVVRTSAGRDSGIHTECLHFWGGVSNVVVANSRFTNCAIMDVFIENDHGPAGDVHDITVENNFFDAPGSRAGGASTGSYSLYIAGQGGTLNRVAVRFNSFLSTAIIDSFSGGSSNLAFVGNAGVRPSWQCYKNVEFEYDVWDGAKCSPTDKRGKLGFADPATNDLHLSRTSSAAGAVPVSVLAPGTDIDGQGRPLHLARDAGADQREPARLNLTSGIGSVRLGMSAPDGKVFYGEPRSSGHIAVGGRGPLDTAVYRIAGGSLSIYSSNGNVVGVRTSSAYYTTPAGLGVGFSFMPPRGYQWLACAGAYVGHAGQNDVYLFTGRLAAPRATLRSVLLLRHGYRAIATCR